MGTAQTKEKWQRLAWLTIVGVPKVKRSIYGTSKGEQDVQFSQALHQNRRIWSSCHSASRRPRAGGSPVEFSLNGDNHSSDVVDVVGPTLNCLEKHLYGMRRERGESYVATELAGDVPDDHGQGSRQVSSRTLDDRALDDELEHVE